MAKTTHTKVEQLGEVQKVVDRALRVVETLGVEVTKAAHQARIKLEAPPRPTPKPKTKAKVAKPVRTVRKRTAA
jgi:hypothetical protein